MSRTVRGAPFTEAVKASPGWNAAEYFNSLENGIRPAVGSPMRRGVSIPSAPGGAQNRGINGSPDDRFRPPSATIGRLANVATRSASRTAGAVFLAPSWRSTT